MIEPIHNLGLIKYTAEDDVKNLDMDKYIKVDLSIKDGVLYSELDSIGSRGIIRKMDEGKSDIPFLSNLLMTSVDYLLQRFITKIWQRTADTGLDLIGKSNEPIREDHITYYDYQVKFSRQIDYSKVIIVLPKDGSLVGGNIKYNFEEKSLEVDSYMNAPVIHSIYVEKDMVIAAANVAYN